MLTRPSLEFPGPAWACLHACVDLARLTWTYLDCVCLVWAALGLSGLSWACLSLSGLAWSCLDFLGWPGLGLLRPDLSALSELEALFLEWGRLLAPGGRAVVWAWHGGGLSLPGPPPLLAGTPWGVGLDGSTEEGTRTGTHSMASGKAGKRQRLSARFLRPSSGRTANTPRSCSILPRHSPRIWLLSPPPAHVAGRPRPLGHGKDAACTEASTGPSSEPPWIGALIWGRESGLKKCQAPGPPLCWAPRKRAQGKLRGYLWEAQPNNSNLPIPKHANQRWTTLAIRTSTYNPCSAQLADDDRDAPT